RIHRELLQRVAEGWRLLWLHVGNTGRSLERQGMIRINYRPDDTADRNRPCCYITERGRDALAVTGTGIEVLIGHFPASSGDHELAREKPLVPSYSAIQ